MKTFKEFSNVTEASGIDFGLGDLVNPENIDPIYFTKELIWKFSRKPVDIDYNFLDASQVIIDSANIVEANARELKFVSSKDNRISLRISSAPKEVHLLHKGKQFYIKFADGSRLTMVAK